VFSAAGLCGVFSNFGAKLGEQSQHIESKEEYFSERPDVAMRQRRFVAFVAFRTGRCRTFFLPAFAAPQQGTIQGHDVP